MKIFILIKRLLILPYRKLQRVIYTKMVKIKVAEVKGELTVNKKTIVTNNTILGNNVNFNGMKIEGAASVIIGNNFHSGIDCLFITSYHNYDFGTKIPYDETYIHKPIKIEDNVWLGSRVIILGGVTVGEGAIIQAGSVVVSDIPKYGIAGGAPAKVFKYRNKDHYNKLKLKEKFH